MSDSSYKKSIRFFSSTMGDHRKKGYFKTLVYMHRMKANVPKFLSLAEPNRGLESNDE